MLLHHPGLKGREVTSYQYSKDVLPTLMDVLGLELCSDFKGRSMLREEQERPYVISEYMGPGCPDMLRRKIWFSARDENYIVAYKVGVFEPFDNGELAEVFDLSKDPNQFYNINDKIDRSKIEYLLEPLKERHAEICRDTGLFMDKLRKGQ
jgi:arylsulfatase A-like enzyme